MTEKEFIDEWWASCKGCEIHDTAHTVETEDMRKLYQRIVSGERERCAQVADAMALASGQLLIKALAEKIREGSL